MESAFGSTGPRGPGTQRARVWETQSANYFCNLLPKGKGGQDSVCSAVSQGFYLVIIVEEIRKKAVADDRVGEVQKTTAGGLASVIAAVAVGPE